MGGGGGGVASFPGSPRKGGGEPGNEARGGKCERYDRQLPALNPTTNLPTMNMAG